VQYVPPEASAGPDESTEPNSAVSGQFGGQLVEVVGDGPALVFTADEWRSFTAQASRI
jgi:hypothetical protein